MIRFPRRSYDPWPLKRDATGGATPLPSIYPFPSMDVDFISGPLRKQMPAMFSSLEQRTITPTANRQALLVPKPPGTLPITFNLSVRARPRRLHQLLRRPAADFLTFLEDAHFLLGAHGPGARAGP